MFVADNLKLTKAAKMKIEEFIESIMNKPSMVNLNKANAFPIEKDRFRCRNLDSKEVDFTDDADFEMKLRDSLLLWEQDGTRGVWAKVAIEHSTLVPVLTELGFHFHHAQRDYVMLKIWLAKNEPDNTPDYAGQYLGCAGFVVNSKNQVLVVQEKYHTKKHWKLPGGHADPGEEIGEAARREVFEETGIQSEFQTVICFRHQHNYKHGCSDFYFVCLMTPINENICKGDNEISACQWMDVQDLIDHPGTAELNRYIARCYQKLVKQGHMTLSPTPVLSVNKSVQELVYSVQPCMIECGRTVTVEEQNIEGLKNLDLKFAVKDCLKPTMVGSTGSRRASHTGVALLSKVSSSRKGSISGASMSSKSHKESSVP